MPLFGYDTETAMRSGAVRGVVADIAEGFRRASKEYGAARLVFTGGDAEALVPMVEESLGWKAQAVMVLDLVAIGLNRILSYNEDI